MQSVTLVTLAVGYAERGDAFVVCRLQMPSSNKVARLLSGL